MPDRSDISPLSITDGKISKGAKIDPTKLAPATSGQVLIAGTDGKFRPGNLVTTSSGDTVAQGPAGATGATGSQGATGTTGATGAAGVDGTDATVTATTVDAAGAIMHTDVPASDTGFVKRTGAETYDVDTATYSTTDHGHTLEDISDAGGAAALDVWAGVGDTEDTVCAGGDSRLADTRNPNSHKSTHSTGGTDVLSPSDIGASATGHTHSYSSLTSIPTAFAPSAHNHSGTDITSGTIDTDRLDVGASSGKVAAGDHAHASYITGNQTITLGGDVSGSGTTSIDCTVDDDSHNHAIGTITGVLNASAGAGSAGKLIKLDAAGHIDSTMINDADISYGSIADVPSTFAPSSHNHAASEITSGTLHADRYTDTTYTADDGIALSGGAFSVAAGTGLSQDSSGLSLNLQGVAEEAIDSNIDYMVFLDGGATGAAKKESLADLVTEISGEGASTSDGEIRLTAANGILSLYASDLRSQSKIKYTKDITWETNSTGVSFSVTDTPTGDVSSAVCTITHNLNTKYIFVSVIEFSTTDSGGDTNFVDNLQEQIDMNFHLTVKPTNDNNIELYTNSGGIYAGSVFKVAIMG